MVELALAEEDPAEGVDIAGGGVGGPAGAFAGVFPLALFLLLVAEAAADEAFGLVEADGALGPTVAEGVADLGVVGVDLQEGLEFLVGLLEPLELVEDVEGGEGGVAAVLEGEEFLAEFGEDGEGLLGASGPGEDAGAGDQGLVGHVLGGLCLGELDLLEGALALLHLAEESGEPEAGLDAFLPGPGLGEGLADDAAGLVVAVVLDEYLGEGDASGKADIAVGAPQAEQGPVDDDGLAEGAELERPAAEQLEGHRFPGGGVEGGGAGVGCLAGGGEGPGGEGEELAQADGVLLEGEAELAGLGLVGTG